MSRPARCRKPSRRRDSSPTCWVCPTRSAALGSGLLAAGIVKGTRVGLIMPNSADWARIALAVTRIGAVLVPLSTLLTTSELTAQLRTASVQHLIAVEEFRG